MKKRLLVFSVDAMTREDMEYLKTLHNFRKYVTAYAEVKQLRTIYPSVTYPIHASIITGRYPGNHGVYSNFKFTTDDKNETWNWFRDSIQGTDIFTLAKQHGYSTASVFWPVTGCHPAIDRLINEYWMPLPGDTLESSFRRAGSDEDVIRIISKNEYLLPRSYKKGGKTHFMVEPYNDNFLIACACDIIRTFQTEVTFVHNGILDFTRHTFGAFNDEVTKGIVMVDYYLGQLMEALEDINHLDDTDVMILSDHGQMNIKRIAKPNVLLAEAGLITLDAHNKVQDWQAYSFSNAMSSMIFLKDPKDMKLRKTVHDFLKKLAEEGCHGFTEIFTKDEIREMEHLDGDFSFVLESDGDSSFSDSCTPPELTAIPDSGDFRFSKATHGYLPDKGPQPALIAWGPSFAGGGFLERSSVVDIAPTLASVLGFTIPGADGKAMEALLRR